MTKQPRSRVFVGLIRDHRSRIGRIIAVSEEARLSGCESESKDLEKR